MSRTKKVAQFRNFLVQRIADEFDQSGIDYTCGAVVKEFARKRIVPLTDNNEFRPYLAHAMLTMRQIEKAVWDEIHYRWKSGRYAKRQPLTNCE